MIDLNIAQSLSKSAHNVQLVLAQAGLEYKVSELSESTRTAQDAAQTLGCNIGQIVKSLIFKTELTDQPVLILASGLHKVNEKTIEFYVKEKIVKADAAYTKHVTGFAIGGIPPLGHAQPIEHIFIDEALLKYDTVWAAAGTPRAVFELRSHNLVTLTKGKIISIV